MPDLPSPIVPAPRYRGTGIAAVASVLFALAVPVASASEASPNPAATGATAVADCVDAKALPAEASDDERRIACEIPKQYRRDVTVAQVVGARLRLHDLAAWLTTDALLAEGAFKRMPGEGRGWLTLRDGNGDDVQVRYYAEVDGQVAAFAAARLDADAVKAADARRLSPPQPMDEREARLMKAKTHALESEFGLCTRHPPNTVVLEANEEGREEIHVFVMSSWKDKREAPLGGFHMFRYTADGATQLDHFSQTRGCVVADLGAAPGKGEELAYLAVTHLNSAAPTMFHVLLSLQYRKPLMVMTAQNQLIWQVENGRIHLLDTSDADEKGADDAPPADDASGKATPAA